MKTNCKLLGFPEQQEKLGKLLIKTKKEKTPTLSVLKEIQNIYGFLPENVLQHVSFELGIPLSELFGVASFYAFFKLKPIGKHTISVCTGTACFVKGSQKLLEQLCISLKIKPGETTADGLFTLTQTRCIGCCGLAPVLTVDEEVFSKVSLASLDGILKKFQEAKK